MSALTVLDEVEALFQKISALPEEVRQAALSKIQERLHEPAKEKSGPPEDPNPSIDLQPPDVDKLDSADQVLTSDRIDNPTYEFFKRAPQVVSLEPAASSTPDQFTDASIKKSTSKPLPALKEFKKHHIKEMHVDFLPAFPLCDVLKHGTLLEPDPEPWDDYGVTDLLEPLQPVLENPKVENNKKLVKKTVKEKPTNSRCKRPYVCPKCNRTFHHSSNLKVHMKRHDGERNYACEFCPYRSVTKMDMMRHQSSAHTSSKDFMCEYCAKSFATRRSLVLHINTIHEKRPNAYHCAHCSFSSSQKNNLRVHVRMRHLEDYYTHVCPVCGDKVRLKSAFLEHLRAHTGDRPFQCDQCPASFACVSRLNTHRRTLHAPRQFICDTCGNKFPTKYGLQRHQAVHTNSKPHSCPYCSFACNMQGNLTKHVRKIHAQPDFSLRRFKREQRRQEGDLEGPRKVLEGKKLRSWAQSGQEAFKQYLEELSKKLGREVTMEELQAQELERRRLQLAASERNEIERINRITSKEHSYVLKPRSPSPPPAPMPTSITVPAPLDSPDPPSNIYLEAMAAANLDFTSAATLAEAIPDLGDPVAATRPFPDLKLVGEDFAAPSPGFLLPEDKLSMDPLLSTYSDVLQVPALQGLEPLTTQPILDSLSNLFVQLPSGEKVQLSLNMLKDCQLMDPVVDTPSPLPLPSMDGLLPPCGPPCLGVSPLSSSLDYLHSVFIVVSDQLPPQDPAALPPG